jgi:hypothetical protein
MLVLVFVISYAVYILRPPVTPYERLSYFALVTITNLLFYTNYAKSFYLYTLTSNLFRSIFIQRIKIIAGKTFGQHVSAAWEASKTNNAEVTAGARAQQAVQLK